MRRALSLGLLVVLAAACSARDKAPDRTVTARTAVDRYVVDFWVKRDTSALAKALSPSMIYHYNGKIIPGEPTAHFAALRSFGSAFPDLAATIDVFTVSGDTAAAVTTWTGTHSGEMCKQPGSGVKVSWVVNYVFRFEQGRIVELWEAWDEGGLYNKLGIDFSKC